MSIRSVLRRLAVPTAVGALAAGGLVAVTVAPSQAADPVDLTTTTTLKVDKAIGEYGGYLSLTGDVKGSDGYSPYDGTAYLQKLSGSTWVNVATDTSPGFLYFPTVSKFTGKATYRVYYEGGSSPSYNWAPSASAAVTVQTYRKLTINRDYKKRNLVYKGKWSPKGKMKFKILKKQGKKWKKFATIKTNKKGKFTFSLPAPNRGKFKFRILSPGSAQFISLPIYEITTYKTYYRTAAGVEGADASGTVIAR